MAKVTDMNIRKMVGIKGETQKVSIGGGVQLWVTIISTEHTCRKRLESSSLTYMGQWLI